MPIFEIEKDGKLFEVEAPDMQTAAAAMGPQQPSPPIAQPYEEPNQGMFEQSGMPAALDTFHDATTGVGMGSLFNFKDEMLAGMATPFRVGARAVTGGDEGKGLGERFSDAYGTELETQRTINEGARERSPIATTVGEVAGGLATGGQLAKGGMTLLNVAKPTVGRMAAAGAGEGAAYGAAYGLGEGEGASDRLSRAVMGAGIGGLTGGLVGVAGGKLANRSAQKAVPTTAEIKEAGGAAYKAADDADLMISADSLSGLKGTMERELADFGWTPKLQPRVTAVLDEVERVLTVPEGAAQAQPITLKGVEQIRKIAKRLGDEPADREVSRRLVGAIDDYLGNLAPTDVVGGNAQQGMDALKSARENWGRYRRASSVEDAVKKAERRAASTGTGGNVENATRQNIRKILDNPKLSRGFSKEELQAMEEFVAGSTGQNLARLVGRLSPQGNGLMAALGIGATAFNPLMAALPATGMVSRALANRMSASQLSKLQALVRAGGKLPDAQLSPTRRALLEALTKGGAQQTSSLVSPGP